MRIIIQRVTQAEVKVEGKNVGAIAQGLIVLVGFEEKDTIVDIEKLTKKIIHLRIFSDAEGKMNKSLIDVQGHILLISQFTLYANTQKGNRPSYIEAAPPAVALGLYEATIHQLETLLARPIQKGIFGADMQVFLCNDGPVTICMDSRKK